MTPAAHWLLQRAIACFVMATPAAGSEPLRSDGAKEHFRTAQEQFELREYGKAAVALEAAYSVEPSAQLLYPWAQAERLDGNCERAVELYRRFLASGPPEEHAELARENIASCERALARKTPQPQPPASNEIPPPTDAAVRRPWQRDIAAGVLVGVGAGMLAAGTGVMIGAASNAAAADEAKDVGDYERRVDQATLQRNVALGVLAAGGAAVIAGVVRYAVLARRERRSLGLWIDGGGAGVLVVGRFGLPSG